MNRRTMMIMIEWILIKCQYDFLINGSVQVVFISFINWASVYYYRFTILEVVVVFTSIYYLHIISFFIITGFCYIYIYTFSFFEFAPDYFVRLVLLYSLFVLNFSFYCIYRSFFFFYFQFNDHYR